MAFETSKFGSGGAAGTGNVVSVVHNHFGQRVVGGGQGALHTVGAYKELVLELTGAILSAQAFPLMSPKLPANVRVTEVFFEVETAFNLGGTTPAIEIGTATSEATNGFTISETIAEAVGVYDLTSALSGTWAGSTGLTAATTLGIVLSGTTPTATTAGKGKVIIRYINV